MPNRIASAEAEIEALIESWAAAVRRHDVPAILGHHADDIVMFDVPPPLQSRGMAAYEKTWDLFFTYYRTGQASMWRSCRYSLAIPLHSRLRSCAADRAALSFRSG